MENTHECYWSNARSCNISLNTYEGIAFIIASNDPSRIELLNKLKNIIKEFDLEPKIAVELEENNQLSAFCDSICAYILGSRISIVDLTAPLKQYDESDSLYEDPSMNVYWEYGYAAGLKKPIILMCDEKQAKSIPFNILDKQILYYNEDNIEEELGRLLQQKLSQANVEVSREVKVRHTEPLHIGKTTDALKTMGMGEMIDIIRKASFQDLHELTENIMETFTHIETWEGRVEFDGLYSFINLLLKSPFSDEEYIKIFETILKKFLELLDFRIDKIREKISESIRKAPVKNWIRKNQLIDDLINVFIESQSFNDAGINSQMVYPFAEELSESQVIRILENVLTNDQIRDSFKAKPILYAIIRIHREKIPIDLWSKLIDEELDEQGKSIKGKFKKSGFAITYTALHLILSLEDSWKTVELIIKQASSIPNFNNVINLSLLKEILHERIQEKLSIVSSTDFDKEISEKQNQRDFDDF